MNVTSNSQAAQDIFALRMNELRTRGYFIDLGSNEPFIGNNSATLELLGWDGFLVDYNPVLVERCSLARRNPAIYKDLTITKLSELMTEMESPEIVDYLSMDLDDEAALPCIKSFDFSSHKIRCMTFEHDYYLRGASMRDESRKFLESKGLEIVCSDVCIFGGKSFEDWYINPTLIPKSVYSKTICNNTEFSNIKYE